VHAGFYTRLLAGEALSVAQQVAAALPAIST
jgi:hypothetical protein